MLPTVTRWFIRGVIRDGRLTEARKRFETGTAKPSPWKLDGASCWSVVCEEVIDTDHNPEGYDAVYAELARRGFTGDEIDEMRRLAWSTAGWLNYDMMVWDWCHLDEHDMREALNLKLEKHLIRRKTYDEALSSIQRFLDRDPPETRKRIAEQAVAPNP
ncbi:hypothetical protein [Haloferula sargassicola]|uniref:Uncharacterized protein n=1 Tax=Haloferula sargassicola TaxID=490096 RepID=A0ABP9ULL9_9BACT